MIEKTLRPVRNENLAMPVTREQALEQLQAWTTNPSLLTHARSVEIVMRAAAAKYGGDPEVWGVTGLLHDADYDRWSEDHPKRTVDWLREQGEEETLCPGIGNCGERVVTNQKGR